jgi:hypothetical protein
LLRKKNGYFKPAQVNYILQAEKKKLPCAALLFEKQSMTNQAIGPFGK